jgi:hypothetical protein
MYFFAACYIFWRRSCSCHSNSGEVSVTHYSLEKWSDFARNRASEASVAQMQRHLDEGCAACAQVLGLWRSVLEVASRETGFQAPETGVQCAKALYRIARPEKAGSLPLRWARLVFSSAAEPLRVGVRGAGASTSHLLFEEGNYLLDLHVKPEEERGIVSVAGQILDRAESLRVYANSSVAVLREMEELARTATNELGEFQLEFPPDDNLMLTVNLEGESILVSALPGLNPRQRES